MGKAAEVAGYGGAAPRDGGAGDARAVRRRGRAARPAAEHTAARRRVRPGRAPTVAGPLSARRADEEQRAASPEQVRERRAGVGRSGGGGAGAARRGGRRRQEGRPAAEGDAVVGAHGRAARAALPAGRRAAALRDGAAPRAAARRVTPPAPRPTTPLPYHAYIPLSGRSDSPECTRVASREYYRLGIYLFGTRRRRRPGGALPVIRAVTVRTLRTDDRSGVGARRRRRLERR